MLLRFAFALVLLVKATQSAVIGNEEEAFVVSSFEEPAHDEYKNVSLGDGRESLRVTLINHGTSVEDIDFQSLFPRYAKIESFSMIQNDITYQGKKVSRQKAHDIVKRAAAEGHNAGLYIPKLIEDANGLQGSENILRVNPQTKVSFNILYEETPDGIDLRKEKFLSLAKVILDLQGESAEDLSAQIMSSNYPGSYPNSADITWLIKVPDNHVISLAIVDLEIEECCDRLTVYDGQSNQFPVLSELTGSLVPKNELQSSSTSMFLRFSSDCSLSKRGFRGIVHAVKDSNSTTNGATTTSNNWITSNSSHSCNGLEYLSTYPYNNYYLSSPGYPYYPYTNNLNCEWRVQSVYSGYVVQLDVIDIQLETCCDYVDIFDGPSPSYTRLVRLTNQTTTVYSSNTYMYIRFRTDHSGTAKGFYFRYSATTRPTTVPTSTTSNSNRSSCSALQYLTAYQYTNYYLSSPGYPSSYDNYLSCDWRIQSYYSNYVIQLDVLDIDLETCCDYVDVYDGSSSSSPLLARLNTNSYIVYSTGRYMYIRFRTDSSVTDKGFQLRYTATTRPPTTEFPDYTTRKASNDPACSPYGSHLELYTGSGYINSTNYPGYYLPNSDCSWFIHGHYSSYVVQLQVLDFYLSSGDAVYIYDGSSTYYPLLRTLTGSLYNVVVTSTGTNMYIRFTSNRDYQARGFQFRYQAVVSTVAPTTPYPETENSTNNHPACTYGSHIDLYSGSGHFSSPNYPSYYFPNANCSWFIQGHYSYYVVRLQSLEFSLNSGDRVRIHDGSSSFYPILRTLSGSWYSVTVQSTGMNMFITFTTDNYYESRGFNFRYEAIVPSATTVSTTEETTYQNIATCPSGTPHLHPSSGSWSYIESPGYPNMYGTGLDCRWLLHSNYYGYDIRLNVLYMNIERGYDFLRVYDGSSSSYPQIVALTGTQIGTYISTGVYMYLVFSTNGITTSSDKGFRLGYILPNYQPTSNNSETTDGVTAPTFNTETTENSYCGYQYLTASNIYSNAFTSPGYPNYHPQNLNCYWRITASYSYIIQLNIVDIGLETYGDYIRIYDGSETYHPLLRSITSNIKYLVYSTGSSMLVNFRTEYHSSNKGFQASYASVYRLNCFNAKEAQNSTQNTPLDELN